MKILSTGKTCPKCESDSLHRKFKSPWMRRMRVSKYYKCANCGHEIIVLFGYKLDRRLPLYSLIAFVSIVCTIVFMWVVVLIAKDIGYKERNVKEFLKLLKPIEQQQLSEETENQEQERAWEK